MFKALGALVFVHYPRTVGKYKYIDDEGDFEIFAKNGEAWVRSTPRDNPHGYEHRVLDFNGDCSFKTSHGICVMVEKERFDIGGGAYLVRAVMIPVEKTVSKRFVAAVEPLYVQKGEVEMPFLDIHFDNPDFTQNAYRKFWYSCKKFMNLTSVHGSDFSIRTVNV